MLLKTECETSLSTHAPQAKAAAVKNLLVDLKSDVSVKTVLDIPPSPRRDPDLEIVEQKEDPGAEVRKSRQAIKPVKPPR